MEDPSHPCGKRKIPRTAILKHLEVDCNVHSLPSLLRRQIDLRSLVLNDRGRIRLTSPLPTLTTLTSLSTDMLIYDQAKSFPNLRRLILTGCDRTAPVRIEHPLLEVLAVDTLREGMIAASSELPCLRVLSLGCDLGTPEDIVASMTPLLTTLILGNGVRKPISWFLRCPASLTRVVVIPTILKDNAYSRLEELARVYDLPTVKEFVWVGYDRAEEASLELSVVGRDCVIYHGIGPVEINNARDLLIRILTMGQWLTYRDEIMNV